jgi:hypothetical protein
MYDHERKEEYEANRLRYFGRAEVPYELENPPLHQYMVGLFSDGFCPWNKKMVKLT